MYEEVPNWSFRTFLTHLHGVVPDLRYGPDFDIDRYAAVSDSRWAKLLFDWWRVVQPIWPVAPDEMRYFDSTERERALDWFSEKG
ncbi:STAS/SEC14 domain-containing protein [Halorubrum trapanicum]|uniref:STAS/SEC14 domain-containing protein n=1 Tax=Halorubrum trapanicum TaxID=29284 RepID=UPI003C6EF6E9